MLAKDLVARFILMYVEILIYFGCQWRKFSFLSGGEGHQFSDF